MNAQIMSNLRDMEHKQLSTTHSAISAQITVKRLRGESTRHLETCAKNITALLNDIPMAGVSDHRALMRAAVPRR